MPKHNPMVDTENMFAESCRLIARTATESLSPIESMRPWFEYCDRVAPEHASIWKRLRQLDFQSDSDVLTDWLTDLFRSEPPGASINGLWFGLFNPELDNCQVSCQMYISGSRAFNPDSESNEWACDLSWRPLGQYSTSPILDEIYRSVQPIEENDVSYLGECFLCHGYLASVLSLWCDGPERSILLGDAPMRAIAMGHDSGDFHRFAVLRR